MLITFKEWYKMKSIFIILISLFILVSCERNGLYDTAKNSNTEDRVPTKIYMFATSGTVQGNFSNGYSSPREAADTICRNEYNSSYTNLGCNNVRAFINGIGSNGSDDEIVDMPSNYNFPTNIPIMGPTEIIFGNDWADLFDGAIQNSLTSTGVTSQNWWSGSATDGRAGSTTCSQWTDTAVVGTRGCSIEETSTWLSYAQVACTSALVIICLGW